VTTREQQAAERRRAATLGTSLALAREAAQLTQGGLAARAGTSRATIAQIESGEGDPRLSTIGAIAEALGIPTFVLLLGKPDIERLAALAGKHQALAAGWPRTEEMALMGELADSPLPADQRRAARLASEIAAARGYLGVGAGVGAAIGTMLLPGTGTIVGALLGAEKPRSPGRARK
jgi:transcriptional regulator with XRE-family HTH domain